MSAEPVPDGAAFSGESEERTPVTGHRELQPGLSALSENGLSEVMWLGVFHSISSPTPLRRSVKIYPLRKRTFKVLIITPPWKLLDVSFPPQKKKKFPNYQNISKDQKA